jgi:hypothetical protein
VNCFCLGPEQIDGLWDEFSSHIYRLERLGHLSADEMREDLRLAKRQLWGIQGPDVLGIAITRIAGKTCEVVAATGKQTQTGQIEALYAHIERWAKDIGCERMRIIGRKGWLRKFPEFTQTGIVIEKDL